MKILSLLLLLSIALDQQVVTARRRNSGGGGSPTATISCFRGSPSFTHTISSINTTGANAIYAVVTSFNSGPGAVTVAATTAGSMSAVTPFSDGNSPSTQIFRIFSPTTSASETFTVSGSSPGLYDTTCLIIVAGVTGIDSGSNNNITAFSAYCSTTTCQPGPLTPSGAGQQMVIACFGTYQSSVTPTIDSSFTGLQFDNGVGGTAYGEMCAYKVQTSGTLVDPTSTWSNSATTPGGVITAAH